MRWSGRCAMACGGPKSCWSRRSSSSTPSWPTPGFLYDGSEERRSNYTLEGGDVHYLRPDLLVLGLQRAQLAGGARRAVRYGLRAGPGHGRDRRGHAEGADGDPPRHGLHPGGPRAVRRFAALFPGPRAARRAPPAQGRGRRARAARLLHRAARGGARARAGHGRRRSSHQPGAGAVELRLQFPRGAAQARSSATGGTTRRSASCSAPASGSCRRSISWHSTTGPRPSTEP